VLQQKQIKVLDGCLARMWVGQMSVEAARILAFAPEKPELVPAR
jgi:hypothetical protein